MHTRQPQLHAFSLVELAIVLVIIGLLIGGVMAGRNLMAASRLRAVSTEYEKYVQAVGNFRTQFSALPGDFPNATKIWGTGTCPGTSTQGSTSIATCDGNGDGQVTASNYEVFRFWQHLANGSFIEGTYSGVTASSGGYTWASAASNSPTSRFERGVLWSTIYANNATGTFTSTLFNYNFGNMFHLGQEATGSWNYGAFFTPVQAWNVDIKLDDGMPGKGNVLGSMHTNCTTAASASDYTSEYKMQERVPRCTLTFMNAY